MESHLEQAQTEVWYGDGILLYLKFLCKTMLPHQNGERRKYPKSSFAVYFFKLRGLPNSAKLWSHESAKPWV